MANQQNPISISAILRPPEIVVRDEEHLVLIGRYHFILGAIYAVGVLYLGAMLSWKVFHTTSMNSTFLSDKKQVGTLLIISVRALSVLLICVNGWFIGKQRYWLCCIILAVLECAMPVVMLDPMGFILGLSATLVLRRPTVKAFFNKSKQQD